MGTALVLFLIIFAGTRIALMAPDAAETVPVLFVVGRGEGVRDIAARLEERRLIKSAIGFTLYSLTTGRAVSFKPGAYSFTRGMSGEEIARMLETGFPAITVTVKEGMTLVDIDRTLAEAGVMRAGELIEYDRGLGKSLEGFLFPETYTFSGGTPAAEVARIMRDAFDANIGPLADGMSDARLYETLIIASLIEKEAMYPHDRLGVSGVLHRRMKLNMPLQIDASSVYAKCQGAYMTCSSEDRVIYRADLAKTDPYNTYSHASLPPTPIANPGKDAFAAALHPRHTAHLYYISNPATSRLIFSETLEGHNENRRRYHIN